MSSQDDHDPPTATFFSQPRVLRRLGLASLRGRYLAAAAVFALMVVGTAWYAQFWVRSVTLDGVTQSTERATIRALLRVLTDDIWSAQAELQGYLLVPRADLQSEALSHIDSATVRAAELAERPWVRHNADRRDTIARLTDSLRNLQLQANRVMELRSDPRQLFPALPTALGEMLPTYEALYGSATRAMVEAEADSDRPGQARAYRLFSEARHSAALMAGAFRLWISNRFGVFGETAAAMRPQEQNVLAHIEHLDRLLEEIGELQRDDQLGMQQEASLREMRQLSAQWLAAFRRVVPLFTAENWRTDTPLLRDRVQPLFENAWDQVRILHAGLDRHSTDDMVGLSALADRLSESLWALALFGLLVTSLGFLVFEFAIRRPIARIAGALREEAQGPGTSDLPSTQVAETAELVAAFGQMRAQVHSRQRRLETILDNAAQGIITFDPAGMIRSFNHAAERLFGYREEAILGTAVSQLLAMGTGDPQDPEPPPERLLRYVDTVLGQEVEATGRHHDGTLFPTAIRISAIELEGQRLYTVLVEDISERKAIVEHLKNLAEHDGLTGLYNRTYFQQELERVVERVRRGSPNTCALLYVDLDNFKYVNDTLGHAAGDHLLVEVAGIFHRRSRRGDLIARFGGDEFTVLIFDVNEAQALHTAESYRRQLAEYTFRYGGEQVDVGCSIGVTLVRPETVSATEALSQADLACHLAKRSGRNRVHLFGASDTQNVTVMSLDMGWSRRIKEAIDRNRFALACQPIVDTRTRRVECYEVLLRLRDGDDVIMPAGFLPSAERFGLSVEIDQWVIRHAIEHLARRRRHEPGARYSINLSGQTVGNPAVCEQVVEALARTRLDPAALTFEVTETVAISDMPSAEAFLSRLKDIGCRTALDDFGSGMCSFAYLKDLPADFVKIDGRFVRNLAVNTIDQAMVRAMNEIVHAIGKLTIAEFVETPQAMQLLADFGVDYAQGHHLGRAELVPDFLEDTRARG